MNVIDRQSISTHVFGVPSLSSPRFIRFVLRVSVRKMDFRFSALKIHILRKPITISVQNTFYILLKQNISIFLNFYRKKFNF